MSEGFIKKTSQKKNLLNFKEFGDNMMERCYPGHPCGVLDPFNKAILMGEHMRTVLLLILGLIPIRDNGMMRVVRIQSTSSVRKTSEQNHFNSFQNYVFLFYIPIIIHDNYRIPLWVFYSALTEQDLHCINQ